MSYFVFLPLAVQSLNSLNDQIASFMVTGPKPLEQEEHTYHPPEKENLQKSMTLMRHLLGDAQVQKPGAFMSSEWFISPFILLHLTLILQTQRMTGARGIQLQECHNV